MTYDKYHKMYLLIKSRQNKHNSYEVIRECQVTKFEALTKKYLDSFLDISEWVCFFFPKEGDAILGKQFFHEHCNHITV